MTKNRILDLIQEESGLFVGLFTLGCFLTLGRNWTVNLSGWLVPMVLMLWLFPVMLWLSFRVVSHADCLAVKLGEPFGTLILTLSVISIEVIMISALMLLGENNPTLGRDMMFAVLMIVLNGLIGAALLCGSYRHLEQMHNLQGANTFLVVLIPLAVLSLILPNYTVSTEPGTFSIPQMLFNMFAAAALYGSFLVIQTMRHQGFFIILGGPSDEQHDHDSLVVRSVGFHATMLIINMMPIILLSKSMAKIIEYSITIFHAPVAFGGMLIAILVLAPEGLAAIKSAIANQLQRSINVCLGSALATIGLTVPAILLIGLITGNKIVLGLDPVDSTMLIMTLIVSLITFSTTKTNIIHGIVHLIIFTTYVLMIFD